MRANTEKKNSQFFLGLEEIGFTTVNCSKRQKWNVVSPEHGACVCHAFCCKGSRSYHHSTFGFELSLLESVCHMSCHDNFVIGLIDVVMVTGIKHKLMLEGQCVQPRRRGGKVVSSRMNLRPKRHGNKSSTTSSSQSYHCDVCNIVVNSETQLKQVSFINSV